MVDEWISIEQWWNDSDRGNLKHWEEICPIALSSTQIPHWLAWNRARASEVWQTRSFSIVSPPGRRGPHSLYNSVVADKQQWYRPRWLSDGLRLVVVGERGEVEEERNQAVTFWTPSTCQKHCLIEGVVSSALTLSDIACNKHQVCIFIVSPCIFHIFINLYQRMHYILTKILHKYQSFI